MDSVFVVDTRTCCSHGFRIWLKTGPEWLISIQDGLKQYVALKLPSGSVSCDATLTAQHLDL